MALSLFFIAFAFLSLLPPNIPFWTSGVPGVCALPTAFKQLDVLEERANLVSLAPEEISRLGKQYASYAAAAYCQREPDRPWECGVNCLANPGFQVLHFGGNGRGVQYWYVGYDPRIKTIIVAYQGTARRSPKAVFTNLRLNKVRLDSRLFPQVPQDIMVHKGFSIAHAKSARTVLRAVKDVLARKGYVTPVTVIGHSLGGAIALLSAIHLGLHLPGVKIDVITYGQPRVGNQAFATYVDKMVKLTRVTNKRDAIAIVPTQKWGYRHSKDEVHIKDDGTWLICPGGDNPDPGCSVGDVKGVGRASLKDHSGPYGGVWITSKKCAKPPLGTKPAHDTSTYQGK